MSTGDSYTPQDQNIDNIGLLNSPSSATPVAQPTKISLPEDMVQMNNNLYPNEDRDPNRQDNYQGDIPLNQPGIPYNHHHGPGNEEPHTRFPNPMAHVPSDSNSQQENTTPNEDNVSNSSLSLDNIHHGSDMEGDKKDGSRSRKRSIEGSDEGKQDQAYWEKRRKNNESAKRSRDARRMKEEQIAMRVVYLEQENLQLRTEAQLLKSEIDKLRSMLYNMQ